MITIFDKDGKPHKCFPVDARELLATGQGWTEQGIVPEEGKSENLEELELARLRGLLDQRNIEYHPQLGAKKLADLIRASDPSNASEDDDLKD
jgi:hypothetical protein